MENHMFENYNSAQKLAYSYLDRILEVYGEKNMLT